MKAGTDYFSGMLRSAGLSGTTPLPQAPAATNANDVFDPIESAQEAAPAAPMSARPTALDTAAAQAQAQTPAPAPAPTGLPPAPPRRAEPSRDPSPATLARDPSPAVQAALRWIAAGEPAKTASTSEAPMTPEAPEITSQREAVHPTSHREPSAKPVAPESPPATQRVEPPRREPPPRPHALESTTHAVEAFPRPAVPPRHAETPARTQQLRPTEASKGTSRQTPEVHIGTLHVTLDAATAARFAPPPPAPQTMAAAPETPRASEAPSPTRGSGAHSAIGSGLSRSRLPRW
ncbi:hypothetical protein [Pelomonas cellulosilytica]|uniref:Uncharacterized protein n=1 Tax=Pelomonas cellulosilytica TaxID=2906762 RepID=A0ABS8XX15_9BURK|nr:hypothetical protein [Pelomonas sp. P8]MCE4555798.1 hypothetical protein [Pelomonas sp. P8]